MPSSERRHATVLRATPLALVALLLSAATAVAESPSPTAAAGGDPRSAGSGPGLVGDPLFAIGLVILVAVVSLVATLAYVRATGGPRDT
ncbi:MAG TPA: hypothetical protein VES19_01295 [Candidatus Limnocylindrales bacterium]|nr:hypothetical protein [Candidatus Limnocylindrales bacterium]